MASEEKRLTYAEAKNAVEVVAHLDHAQIIWEDPAIEEDQQITDAVQEPRASNPLVT